MGDHTKRMFQSQMPDPADFAPAEPPAELEAKAYQRVFYYSYDPGSESRINQEAIFCPDHYSELKKEPALHISGFGTLPANPFCHWCRHTDPK